MAPCGMKGIDLTEDIIEVLGIYFSYNKTLEQKNNLLSHIVKIQNILKLWKLRNLTIEEIIIVFMSLAITKIIHLALVIEIPTSIINLLNKIQMDLNGKEKIQKSNIVLYVPNTKMLDSKLLTLFQNLSVYDALG